MTRITLLAAAAVAVLTSPLAFADGKSGNLSGLVDLGYDWRDADVNINSFHGTGAGLWDLNGNWNIQGEFGFNSSRTQGVVVDTWGVGATVFWRDPREGMIGGQLSYQSIDPGIVGPAPVIDGIGIAARGEYYFSPQLTLGGRIRYQNLDVNPGSVDEWSFGATGRYYFEPNFGINLGVNYADFSNSNINPWLLRGEAEYLFHDTDTSVYAGLEFGDTDFIGGSYWGLGVGLRLHLGTTGSLANRDRTGPIQDINTARFPF